MHVLLLATHIATGWVDTATRRVRDRQSWILVEAWSRGWACGADAAAVYGAATAAAAAAIGTTTASTPAIAAAATTTGGGTSMAHS